MFIYKGYTVYVKANGTHFTGLIYKDANFIGGTFGSPLECNGDAEQSAINKAMIKIDSYK